MKTISNFALHIMSAQYKDKDAEASAEMTEYYFQDVELELKYACELGKFDLDHLELKSYN